LREEVKLPKTVKELAAFFDEVDTEELEWEDAEVEFKRSELVSVSVRLPKEDLLAIKKAAAKLGIGYTTYIRMVLRRVASEGQEKQG